MLLARIPPAIFHGESGVTRYASVTPEKRSMIQLNTPEVIEPMKSAITITPGISERS
jgi:hypothetical protein